MYIYNLPNSRGIRLDRKAPKPNAGMALSDFNAYLTSGLYIAVPASNATRKRYDLLVRNYSEASPKYLEKATEHSTLLWA